MTTFVDTSALLAMVNTGEPHHQWSIAKFNERRAEGPMVISDLVYCEFSSTLPTREATDVAISSFGLQRLRSSDDVHFHAGKAFLKYKKRGGTKTNVLPDFLIGALADLSGAPLMTANPRDVVGYFPNLEVIKP